MHETSTRSPTAMVVTAAPISTTVPTASWPRIVPGFTSGTSPLRMCRSVPQIVDESIRTIASVGSMMDRVGDGLPGPLAGPVVDERLHRTPFSSGGLQDAGRGRSGLRGSPRETCWSPCRQRRRARALDGSSARIAPRRCGTSNRRRHRAGDRSGRAAAHPRRSTSGSCRRSSPPTGRTSVDHARPAGVRSPRLRRRWRRSQEHGPLPWPRRTREASGRRRRACTSSGCSGRASSCGSHALRPSSCSHRRRLRPGRGGSSSSTRARP